MKCDISKEKLIGYFYEELPDDDSQDVKVHLKKCAACKQELAAFTRTADILKAWPDAEPGLNLKFIREKASFTRWLLPDWLSGLRQRQIAVGFVGAFVLVLLILSAMNFEASYSDGGFSFKLSLLPRDGNPVEIIEDPMALPITRGEFNDFKEDSYRLMQEVARESQTRNRHEYRAALREFARDVDNQRRQDLTWVGKGFEVVRSTHENKIRFTNQVLQRLIQTANFQPVQPESEQNE